MFKKITLDNGLRIITAPMSGTNTVTVLVLCGTGSDYEPQGLAGISHFLEHMFFKGTSRRPTPEAIKHELDGMGSISNAFTSHEITGYHIKAAKTFVDKSLDLLADIYNNSLLDTREINRERQVIIEEMHRYLDTPTRRIWDIWERLIYGNTPQGREVVGLEQVIRTLSRDDFYNYFLHQYVSSNTAVVVAGNFDEEKAIQTITEKFGALRSDPPFRLKPSWDGVLSRGIRLEYKDSDQTHIAVGFHGFSANHPRRSVAEVLAAALGGSWSSRMWERIRDKLGLAYSVYTQHQSYSNSGYLFTYAGVAHENVEKTIQAALDEYRRIREELMGEAELTRVKDYIRGTSLIGLEASDAVASFVGEEEMVTGKPLTIDEVFAKIDAVTPEDLRDVAGEIIRPQQLNLALIGPFKDGAKFQKLLDDF